MSYNKFDNLYAGFEHRIIPLFLFMWNSLPSVYIVPDSGDAPLLPTLVNWETSLGDLLSPLFMNTVLQLQQY